MEPGKMAASTMFVWIWWLMVMKLEKWSWLGAADFGGDEGLDYGMSITNVPLDYTKLMIELVAKPELQQADVLARYKSTINVTSLVPELEQMDKWGDDALDYFKSARHILFYYEDLLNNHEKVKDVLKFLRLPKRKLSGHHVKIHTRPLSD
ncbi:hypothetical protein COCNU_scaffold008462G000100 [Cocos nucifera]|nr:hypothetical protein [Cocos nucifera]